MSKMGLLGGRKRYRTNENQIKDKSIETGIFHFACSTIYIPCMFEGLSM